MSHTSPVDEDFLWYVEHPEAFEAYRGKHVAIWDRRVAGYGSSAKGAYEMAVRGYPESKPTLAFIPQEEELILVRGLFFPYKRVRSEAFTATAEPRKLVDRSLCEARV